MEMTSDKGHMEQMCIHMCAQVSLIDFLPTSHFTTAHVTNTITQGTMNLFQEKLRLVGRLAYLQNNLCFNKRSAKLDIFLKMAYYRVVTIIGYYEHLQVYQWL